MSVAMMNSGGGSFTISSQRNVGLFLNGKTTRKTATDTFTAIRKGVCVVVIAIGNIVGSSFTVSLSVNGTSQTLNSDNAKTTIDNYHDNDGSVYSSCFAVNKGDKVTVSLGVGSNINDCTWRVCYFN